MNSLEEKEEKEEKGGKAEKVYTQDDVSSGIAGGRTLLLIHNTVYDVTSFVDEHPGGPQVRRERERRRERESSLLLHAQAITDCLGVDATEDFDGVGHRYTATTHTRCPSLSLSLCVSLSSDCQFTVLQPSR